MSPATAKPTKTLASALRAGIHGEPEEPQAEKKAAKRPSATTHFRQMLRARYSLILVSTSEERRVERAIGTASVREGYDVCLWDCATGVRNLDGRTVALPAAEQEHTPAVNPHAVFAQVRAFRAVKPRETAPVLPPDGTALRDAEARRIVWILRDLPELLVNDPVATRALKSLAREIQEEMDGSKLQTIVLLAPSTDLPASLRSSVTVLDWPLPDRAELGQILGEVLTSSQQTVNGDRERVIDAAAGLAAEDAANTFALSIVRHGRIDPSEVGAAKKQIIQRDGLLSWIDPDPRGLDGIGGLAAMKRWLRLRRLAFSPEARAYGLPPLKGVLLVGPPGTGKSASAKCIATAYDLPLLRLDLGAMKSGIIGSSEGRIRGALKTAEAVTRCVLQTEEIEKALAGSRGPSGDSGVSADQLATLLTWRQECELPILWVATCNDPLALPPELVSRFDQVFFVDLPQRSERVEILAVSLRALPVPRDPAGFDLEAVAAVTNGFSGRELDKLVKAALAASFDDGGRPLRVEDMLAAAPETMVVSRSMAESVRRQREWADGRALSASDPEPEEAAATAAVGAGGYARHISHQPAEEEEAPA